jgi:RNA polymerase sigma factor (sigma-70 family)
MVAGGPPRPAGIAPITTGKNAVYNRVTAEMSSGGTPVGREAYQRRKMAPVEGRPLEDHELVERVKRGDVDAYETLVQRHQAAAFRTAYLVAGAAGEAEDAAQEGFVKAYYAIDRFRAGSAFGPWLLAIVANEARDRRRSAARRGSLALKLVEGRPSGDAAPSPEAAALADSEKRRLLEALGKLGVDDRLVIGYRYFLELSEKETAAALGVRRGTVKSRLSRALARLRDEMGTGAGA